MKTMNKTALLSLGSLILFSGCASIVSDRVYPVTVSSSPDGAQFTIRNEDGVVVAKGTTPDTVSLKAGAGFFDGETYTITFKKRNHEPASATLDSELDWWYWGNILFGGAIGMLIVDPATGAMWELPESVSADLERGGNWGGDVEDEHNAHDDVPAEDSDDFWED